MSARLGEGGRIDRDRRIAFNFDGRHFHGFAGDTLASALLASGVRLFGRSFKYHRPRGVLGVGVEEPSALMTVDQGGGRRDVNVRATTLALYEGLSAQSQNRWPSLRLDAGALADLVSPAFSAGFYYKTFMWPRWGWHSLYEPFIRSRSGLGPAPTQADPDSYDHRFAHCDLLIVGAGPAGLSAALAAADSGARVILCDEQEEMGGSLLGAPDRRIDGLIAWDWLERTQAELAAHANVRLLPRTTAFGYYADNMVGLTERVEGGAARERLWQVRAGQVVLASGAIERPLVFPGNDRPGVMLASAVATYLHRYAVRVGEVAVAYVSHDSGYHAAFDFAAGGGEVAAIIDARPDPADDLQQQAEALGIEVAAGGAIVAVKGRSSVQGVVVSDGGRRRSISCDLVMMAGGWTPTVHLFSQSRSPLAWDEAIQAYVPGSAVQAVTAVGACRGSFSLAACLEEGHRAVAGAGWTGRRAPVAEAARLDIGGPIVTPTRGPGKRGKAFVDLQNDVTASDIRQAAQEGFTSIEHIKRYTTNGMATDQGRTSNLTGLAIAAEALSMPISALGLTSYRPPYTPVTFGALAGHGRGALFDPERRTPIHDWAAAQGAVFENVGLWKRARFFPRDGEDMEAAVRRECRQTRAAVGMFDASTLGKIEVVGPDAAEFLNRLYVNAWTKLEVGRCRYGVLLREDGFLMDDGVVGRLAADRFHVTTTTGGAPHVLHMMEDYLQTEFPDLKVWLTSTTEQWTVIALNGPHARKVLEALVEDVDLSADTFPHMSVRVGRIRGVPMRLFRVSFTGELGFEINVPSALGLAVWEQVHREARKHGGVVYGTEAMHVLRAEKGYIIVGQESDGTVTPDDLGLQWAISKAKPDFVGKRALTLSGMGGDERRQLVGLLTSDATTVLEEGAQLVADPGAPTSLGHVTSSYWSEALGRPIALALLAAGRARRGSEIHVAMPGGAIRAEVTGPVFYDPEGSRLNV